MTPITACVDGSAATRAVCDAAFWASTRLGKPLTLLQVLEPAADGSGQQQLLACKQGEILLQATGQHLMLLSEGAIRPCLIQRPAPLTAALQALQVGRSGLTIIGRHGCRTHCLGLDRHLQPLIRNLQQPLLVVHGRFSPPAALQVLASDRPALEHVMDYLGQTPLATGLPCQLYGTPDLEPALARARQRLEAIGYPCPAPPICGALPALLTGQTATTEQACTLQIMGISGQPTAESGLALDILRHTPQSLLLVP